MTIIASATQGDFEYPVPDVIRRLLARNQVQDLGVTINPGPFLKNMAFSSVVTVDGREQYVLKSQGTNGSLAVEPLVADALTVADLSRRIAQADFFASAVLAEFKREAYMRMGFEHPRPAQLDTAIVSAAALELERLNGEGLSHNSECLGDLLFMLDGAQRQYAVMHEASADKLLYARRGPEPVGVKFLKGPAADRMRNEVAQGLWPDTFVINDLLG